MIVLEKEQQPQVYEKANKYEDFCIFGFAALIFRCEFEFSYKDACKVSDNC